MSVTQLSSPDVLAPVGARSYWLASGNPIIFKYQRKDVGIIAITNMAGTIKVTMSSVPTDAEVGQRVYIFNTGYEGDTTIKSIGVGYIELNMIYIGSSTGGFLNLTEARNNYHLDVNIYELLSTGSRLIGNFYCYDNPQGVITVDFQGVLDDEMNMNAQAYDFSVINSRDYGRSFSFDFEYREGWRMEGLNPSTYGALSHYYFVVKSTRQLQATYGQNMREYMLDVATDPVYEDYIAKFITGFERPVYFEGYPFTLSFLYTENVAAYHIIRKEQEKDINGVNVGAQTSATLDYTKRTTLNRLNNRKGYGDNIHSVQIWLEQGDEIDFGGSGYGTGTGGGGASTDYFAEDYDENWGT